MSWTLAACGKSHSLDNLFCQRRKLSTRAAVCSDFTNFELSVVSCNGEFNHVKYLVWVLHECARSFSLAVQSLSLTENGAGLTKAWLGVDVHSWHKDIAHQDLLEEHIEHQLALRDFELVRWFRMNELPRLSDYFAPSIRKWLAEYRGSGAAGITVAISCCVAIESLGSAYLSSATFKFWLQNSASLLFSSTHCLVQVGKLHDLSIKAGFENEFLAHFGANIMSSKNDSEIEFWIELAQDKLSAAFQREGLKLTATEKLHDKVQKNILAVLGLFAYLGRRSRVFLSEMGMKDLDDQITNLLSYMECGSIFIYPELASLAVYQFFMESGSARMDTISIIEEKCSAESRAFHESLLKKFGLEAFSISCNVWMGTRLLLIDIKFSVDLLLKQMHGHKVTYRQMMKLKRTVSDIASLVPVTILMLLPVSAVGHAAILTAIKKYMPSLIPSPYTRDRLDVVKQLNRTKKLKGLMLRTDQAD
ncbi:hypothetical protein QQ045_026449 [Rhodiola kirilowii]